MPSTFPRTFTKGRFKGRTFETQMDYVRALEEDKVANPDPTTPSENGHKPRQARQSRKDPVSKEMALGLVGFANLVLAVIPPTREDTLEDYEQEALVNAVVETARANKWFANLVIKACSLQSSSRLGVTVGAVVVTRLAKRGIVPLPIGYASVGLLQQLAKEDAGAGPSTILLSPLEQTSNESVETR